MPDTTPEVAASPGGYRKIRGVERQDNPPWCVLSPLDSSMGVAGATEPTPTPGTNSPDSRAETCLGDHDPRVHADLVELVPSADRIAA